MEENGPGVVAAGGCSQEALGSLVHEGSELARVEFRDVGVELIVPPGALLGSEGGVLIRLAIGHPGVTEPDHRQVNRCFPDRPGGARDRDGGVGQ